jgi:hypothetical protein
MTKEDASTKPERVEDDLYDEEDLSVLVKRTKQVQRREWWVGWSSVWANFLLPITILIAAVGFWEQTKQAKRTAAAHQIDQFYAEGMIEAQTKLFSLWTQQDLDVLRIARSRAFVDAYVDRTIGASGLSEDEVMISILSITSYFDRVEACIKDGRCAERDVLNQIGQFGRDFYCIYSGQIEGHQRELVSARLGDGLANFAARLDGCDEPAGTTE